MFQAHFVDVCIFRNCRKDFFMTRDPQVLNVPHSWSNLFWSPIEGSKRLSQMLHLDLQSSTLLNLVHLNPGQNTIGHRKRCCFTMDQEIMLHWVYAIHCLIYREMSTHPWKLYSLTGVIGCLLSHSTASVGMSAPLHLLSNLGSSHSIPHKYLFLFFLQTEKGPPPS